MSSIFFQFLGTVCTKSSLLNSTELIQFELKYAGMRHANYLINATNIYLFVQTRFLLRAVTVGGSLVAIENYIGTFVQRV